MDNRSSAAILVIFPTNFQVAHAAPTTSCAMTAPSANGAFSDTAFFPPQLTKLGQILLHMDHSWPSLGRKLRHMGWDLRHTGQNSGYATTLQVHGMQVTYVCPQPCMIDNAQSLAGEVVFHLQSDDSCCPGPRLCPCPALALCKPSARAEALCWGSPPAHHLKMQVFRAKNSTTGVVA